MMNGLAFPGLDSLVHFGPLLRDSSNFGGIFGQQDRKWLFRVGSRLDFARQVPSLAEGFRSGGRFDVFLL